MEVAQTISDRLLILGAAVRAARQQRDWTQSNLATRTGMPVQAVMKIEAGSPDVRIGQVLTLCSALGISVDPREHASTAAQARHLLELASRRKRVRKPRSDPALDV